MSLVRLALLNASYNGYNTRRNFRRELDPDLTEFDVTEGELPETFEFDGFVVTGSAASIYWDEDWIGETREWAEKALDQGLPALGVCFGHQFLADVLGGDVVDMGEYELGFRTVRETGECRLFDGLDEDFTVFETHSDTVEELPPGASQIAENEYGVQGFRDGDVFAVQFHPEYDIQTAREVTEGKDSVSEEFKQEVLDGITDEAYREACEAKVLFENFVSYVEQTRRYPDGEIDEHAEADD